jgi:ADP-ribosylglycohydrolase
MQSDSPTSRSDRARLALEGLSIGDAFGEQFFSAAVWHSYMERKELPLPAWRYTDDTVMALSIVEILERHGSIHQDDLAEAFHRRYQAEPRRGYGAGAAELLRGLSLGGDWRELSRTAFGGTGSFGNGAAMRVAPLGAFFADDPDAIAEQSRLSAEVTHAHPEGIAGSIAVACAAAWAWRWNASGRSEPKRNLLEVAAEITPPGETRDGILRAADIPLDGWNHVAASALGNGSRIAAADTVPFCLWCAAAHLDDYPEALWSAIRVGGDIDTNCAIIGGIVAMAVGKEGIPDEWSVCRESLRQSQ